MFGQLSETDRLERILFIMLPGLRGMMGAASG
jgi:hypothetical protein